MLSVIKKKLISAGSNGRLQLNTSRIVANRFYSYSNPNIHHEYDDPRHDKTVHVMHSRGVNIIHDPLLSKGTAFSLAERERLSLRGLVPPRCQAMDKQLLRVKRNLDACKSPLAKFVFLAALHDRNETLYYKLLMDNLEELAGVIYTPTGKFSRRDFIWYH